MAVCSRLQDGGSQLRAALDNGSRGAACACSSSAGSRLHNGGDFSSTSERSPPYPLNNNKNLGDGGDQREKLEI